MGRVCCGRSSRRSGACSFSCSREWPAVETPKTRTPTTPAARTAQVIPNTPPKPSELDAKPMMAGALIDPSRPKALASPVAVVRVHVGKSSGVYA